MKRIDVFKSFVRSLPNLINYVRNNEMTWQKFYELWDLYGPDHEIWQKYNVSTNANPVEEFTRMIKNIDMDSLRRNIGTIQKGISLFQELFKKDNSETNEPKEPYTPRPLYRRFDD